MICQSFGMNTLFSLKEAQRIDSLISLSSRCSGSPASLNEDLSLYTVWLSSCSSIVLCLDLYQHQNNNISLEKLIFRHSRYFMHRYLQLNLSLTTITLVLNIQTSSKELTCPIVSYSTVQPSVNSTSWRRLLYLFAGEVRSN